MLTGLRSWQTLVCMITENQKVNYRHILRREFEKRKIKNPKYSLRAYAKYLQMAPSRLSEVFTGKRGLSPEVAYKIVDKLEFSDFEKNLFLDFVESEHSRSRMARELASERIREKTKVYSEVDLDTFKMIAEWHHFALLEYFSLPSAAFDFEHIAKDLAIDIEKIPVAIDRLLRLGLLERKNSSYVSSTRLRSTPTDIPSEAIREHHTEMLNKAVQALQKQPVPVRDFQSLILPISREDIPLVKKRLREFQEQLSAELAASPRKNAVYGLLFNFFDLTENMNA